MKALLNWTRCVNQMWQWALWLHVFTNARRREAVFFADCCENSGENLSWAEPALSVG